MNIKQLIKEAHDNGVEKGFYDCPIQNIAEKLMLIVSELSEALEAHRNNNLYRYSKYPEVMNCFEYEIADVFIRLADLCGYLNIDIEKHIEAKMAYNKTRPVKHGKRY